MNASFREESGLINRTEKADDKIKEEKQGMPGRIIWTGVGQQQQLFDNHHAGRCEDEGTHAFPAAGRFPLDRRAFLLPGVEIHDGHIFHDLPESLAVGYLLCDQPERECERLQPHQPQAR